MNYPSRAVKRFFLHAVLLSVGFASSVIGQKQPFENRATTSPAATLECSADYSADVTSGCKPLTVTFTDKSVNAANWQWFFTGGNPSSATGQGPHVVIYNTVGIFDVSLTIGCIGSGDDVETKPEYITVKECPCIANFKALPSSGCAPLTVTFTDESENATSWQWQFPGGSPSSANTRGPHKITYQIAGTYSATLQIECDGDKSDSQTKSTAVTLLDCNYDMDYGDAPNTYNTTKANNGSRHTIVAGIRLGNSIDGEPDGQAQTHAQGDGADEDGINLPAELPPGQPSFFIVNASVAGYLSAWIDFDRDGAWNGANECVVSAKSIQANTDMVYFQVPALAVPGATFARFRFTTSNVALNYTGEAGDGEVEDYEIQIGQRPKNVISGIIWNDDTANGIQDAGEPARGPEKMSNCSPGCIQLFSSNGVLVASTMPTGFTGNSGGYVFTNLPNGEYYLQFNVANAMLVYTFKDQGADDGKDSDVDVKTGKTDNFIVSASTYALDFDAGVYIYTHICGHVWNDLNQNGIYEPQTEQLLSGVSVRLLDGNGQVLDQLVTTNNYYSFPELPPGIYQLYIKLLPGFVFSPKDQPGATSENWDSDVNPTSGYTEVFKTKGYSVDCFGWGAGMYQSNQQFDFGDAPEQATNYPTTLARNGARHKIVAGVYIGWKIDAESDGQPSPSAVGDNLQGIYDEEGFGYDFFSPSEVCELDVTVSVVGYLNVWIDYNSDGDWTDSDEHVIADASLTAGGHTIPILIPPTAKTGMTFLRARFCTQSGLQFDGEAPDGEVNDFYIDIMAKDYGDAPAPYPTTLDLNGARHLIRQGAPDFMGEKKDWEKDGQPNSSATGDDVNGQNDEDGVIFSTPLVIGQTAAIKVAMKGFGPIMPPLNKSLSGAQENTTASVLCGFYVNGWIDFNDDQDWSDADEQIVKDHMMANGMQELISFAVPANAKEGMTFARFRVSSLPVHTPFGLAVDGEVEDYRVELLSTTSSSIGDWVWNDLNQNGQQDKGEPGLANVNVSLFTSSGSLYGTQKTDGTGFYIFSDVPSDSYYLLFALLPGFQFSPKDVGGNDSHDSDVNPTTTKTDVFSLSLGNLDMTRDAGMYESGAEGKYDYGDVPSPYPVDYKLLVNPAILLGKLVDGEPQPLTSTYALLDDRTDLDDEDGVLFTSALVPGLSATVAVDLSMVNSNNFAVQAWIDFDGDGVWSTLETILTGIIWQPGTINTVSFQVPAQAKAGRTFTRFIILDTGPLPPQGTPFGEVEDYQVEIMASDIGAIKWRQWPLKTRDSESPDAGCFFGWNACSIVDQQIVTDDWYCRDPKPVTSVTWWGGYQDWVGRQAPEIAPAAFHIGIWSDVPKANDQTISHPGELIREWRIPRGALNERVVGCDFLPGAMEHPDSCFRYDFIIPVGEWFYQENPNTIYWLSIAAIYDAVPDKFEWGWKTREHYFNDDAVKIVAPNNPSLGSTYQEGVRIRTFWDMAYLLGTDEFTVPFDYGDAPDDIYPTRLLSNGAHHFIDDKVYLGSLIDAEPDGLPNFAAVGDDYTGIDDEDGINFLLPVQSGRGTRVEIRASCDGFVNAWFDFDGNGSWGDADEWVLKDYPVTMGRNYVAVFVPASVDIAQTYARFRFTTKPGISYVGIATDGEVEDYLVNIGSTDVGGRSDGDALGYDLWQNYPNPFNLTTQIGFSLPAAEKVTLAIYDLSGRRVRTLLDEVTDKGIHRVFWDGQDDQGRVLPSGIYMYEILAGHRRVCKAILMK